MNKLSHAEVRVHPVPARDVAMYTGAKARKNKHAYRPGSVVCRRWCDESETSLFRAYADEKLESPHHAFGASAPFFSEVGMHAFKFPIGRLVATPAAIQVIEEAGESLMRLVARHGSGD